MAEQGREWFDRYSTQCTTLYCTVLYRPHPLVCVYTVIQYTQQQNCFAKTDHCSMHNHATHILYAFMRGTVLYCTYCTVRYMSSATCGLATNMILQVYIIVAVAVLYSSTTLYSTGMKYSSTILRKAALQNFCVSLNDTSGQNYTVLKRSELRTVPTAPSPVPSQC